MNQRVNIFSVGLFVIALGLLFWFGTNQQNLRRMQSAFLSIITPFLRSGSAVEQKIVALRSGIATLNQLEADVKNLRISNRDLAATNQALRGIEAENNRLRKAIGYAERAVFQLMPARVIARDASTWYNTVTIDRGSQEAIEIDMPVLTEEGLVGKTTSVAEHTSVVVLISDETCKVAASVEGTREQGIVKGERTSSAMLPGVTLNHLTKGANLQSGQKVFTNGVGGVFPSGVLIGEVHDFKGGQLEGTSNLVPAVNLTNLEDVFVVVSDVK